MDILYHYTTTEALTGMLGNCSPEKKEFCIWATHHKYSNDPQELKEGEDLCQKYLPQIEELLKIPANERIAPYIKDPQTTDLMKSLSLTADNDPTFGSKFIISLSEGKDMLSMWGMYAQNGQGISLGFNRDVLKSNGTLIDCLYNDENIIAEDWILLLRENYERNLSAVKSFHNSTDCPIEWRTKVAAATHFSLFMSTVCLYIKNKAYIHEKESRLLVSGENVKFRNSKNMLIPYIEFGLPTSALEEIIIGPTLDFDRTKLAVMLLLKSKGIDLYQGKIIKSHIPYQI